MDEDFNKLVDKVKVKIDNFDNCNENNKQRTESSMKRERENKKLVNLVSLLTNKLLRLVKFSKSMFNPSTKMMEGLLTPTLPWSPKVKRFNNCFAV